MVRLDKIYVAGSFHRKEELLERSLYIRDALGFYLTSHWVNEEEDHNHYYDKMKKQQSDDGKVDYELKSAQDFAAIEQATVFVLQSEDFGTYTTGGRLVEFGYALGLKRKGLLDIDIVIVGRGENIFQFAKDVIVLPTWLDFYNWLLDRNNYYDKSLLRVGDQFNFNNQTFQVIGFDSAGEPVIRNVRDMGLVPVVNDWRTGEPVNLDGKEF